MSRNKLSPHDRIKSQIGKQGDLVRKYAKGDKQDLLKEIQTIRSLTLKNLIYFNLISLDAANAGFMYINSPEEISVETGISVRQIYDLIKTTHILHTISDTSFKNGINFLLSKDKEVKEDA